jgi:hypothetical protein
MLTSYDVFKNKDVKAVVRFAVLLLPLLSLMRMLDRQTICHSQYSTEQPAKLLSQLKSSDKDERTSSLHQ